jgi:hypothetical protein
MRALSKSKRSDYYRRLRRLEWRARAALEARAQGLADETGLTVHVHRYPPGTSKWNRVAKLGSFVRPALRNAGDDLYLEVEAGEPVYAERSPIRVWWLTENLLLDGHDGSELVFGVSVERGHIHDIVDSAARGVQRRLEVFECQLDLAFEIRFGCSIGTAADLPGDEQEITGSDSG